MSGWTSTASWRKGWILSTPPRLVRTQLSRLQKTSLKRRLQDTPKTTFLLPGWENLSPLLHQRWFLVSGFPEGPVLPEDDPGSDDVRKLFLRGCGLVAFPHSYLCLFVFYLSSVALPHCVFSYICLQRWLARTLLRPLCHLDARDRISRHPFHHCYLQGQRDVPCELWIISF